MSEAFDGFKVSGYSDDSVIFQGPVRNKEQYACGHAVRVVIGRTQAAAGEFPEGVVIEFQYARDPKGPAVWSAIVSPLDEECEIPWPVEFQAKLSRARRSNAGDLYTPTVVVRCPQNTPWRVERRQNDNHVWDLIEHGDASATIEDAGD
jgi:hypothetical protein